MQKSNVVECLEYLLINEELHCADFMSEEGAVFSDHIYANASACALAIKEHITVPFTVAESDGTFTNYEKSSNGDIIRTPGYKTFQEAFEGKDYL